MREVDGMLKMLLKVAMALSILVLGFGLVVGVTEYSMEGRVGMLVLSGIGIAIWVPALWLVARFLMELEKEEEDVDNEEEIHGCDRAGSSASTEG